MNPRDLVAALQLTTPDLSARLVNFPKTWTHGGARITGRFYYLALRDGEPTVDDLITIAFARIINFAIPRQRIAEAKEQMAQMGGSLDPIVTLTAEARDLFIQTKKETGRSGELGEMLLYMLLEWALEAPILASKMYLKTNRQMPVHGCDGIHVGFDGNDLILHFGESKMYADLSAALTAIVESIKEYRASSTSRDNELRIIRKDLSTANLPVATANALRAYFNPYDTLSNRIRDSHACLAGFDSNIYERDPGATSEEVEQKLRLTYESRAESACELIARKVADAGLSKFDFTFFLLPFPSVDVARASFQSRLTGSS